MLITNREQNNRPLNYHSLIVMTCKLNESVADYLISATRDSWEFICGMLDKLILMDLC